LIPVAQQPEPADFEHKVRRLGLRFLQSDPNPTSWLKRSYWTKALPDLRRTYKGICAYSCLFIPPIVGAASVDHFVPKAANPHKAYEWINYRFVSSTMNSRKGEYTDILDPFTLEPDTFTLDFTSMVIKPGVKLNVDQREQVHNTIKRLRLNDDMADFRMNLILDYCDNRIDENYLKQNAPFIAYEMERQKITKAQLQYIFRRRGIDPRLLR
jgi:hypothetical protein